MINKRISKITMLTALFIGGIVNAQEFYTCVPKKSWWGDVIKSNVPSASDITNAVKGAIPTPTPTPEKQWKLLYKGFSGGKLFPGEYELTNGFFDRGKSYYFELLVEERVVIESKPHASGYFMLLPNENEIDLESSTYDLYILK